MTMKIRIPALVATAVFCFNVFGQAPRDSGYTFPLQLSTRAFFDPRLRGQCKDKFFPDETRRQNPYSGVMQACHAPITSDKEKIQCFDEALVCFDNGHI